MNVLLVEDDQTSVNDCYDIVNEFYKDKIAIITAKDIGEAQGKLPGDIDVAIVDIRLGNNANDGNEVIKKFDEFCLRLPTVAHTATPANVDDSRVLKTFTRGEVTYKDIFDYLLSVYNTGITEIVGKKGLLETGINKYYNSVFKNQCDAWIEKINNDIDPEKVKKSLLRSVIYHLEQVLENDDEKTFYEEFYLTPVDNTTLHTGSILIEERTQRYFTVMSPACDLVVRTELIGMLQNAEISK